MFYKVLSICTTLGPFIQLKIKCGSIYKFVYFMGVIAKNRGMKGKLPFTGRKLFPIYFNRGNLGLC